MIMNMKHVFSGLAMALTLTLTLAACSTEEDFAGNNAAGKALSIRVKDGGFGGEGSKAKTITRAIPTGTDGLGTDFTINDSIGIFEVKNGAVTKANYKYINDGSLWNGKNTIEYDANATYFAYFPYISDDNFKTLTGASDINSAVTPGAVSQTYKDSKGNTLTGAKKDSAMAEAFFATLISKWTPKDDQTKLEDYNASDLMVSTGEVPSGDHYQYTMDFTMCHQMGLCLTMLNAITYKVSDTYKFVMMPDYQLVGDNKPCHYQNEYRYIVTPNVQKYFEVKGDGNTYKVNLFVKTKGHYTEHVVGGSESKPKEFGVEVGDIFYSNGGLTHAGTLNPNYTPVGIVGYIPTADDKKKDLLHGYTNALVIGATYDKTSGSVTNDITNNTKFSNKMITDYADLVGDNDGITRTEDLKDVKLFTTGSTTGSTIIDDFNKLLPLTNDKTLSPNSGWFLPVSGQMYAIINAVNVKELGTDIGLKNSSNSLLTYDTIVSCSNLKTNFDKAFSKLGEGHYHYAGINSNYRFSVFSWVGTNNKYSNTNRLSNYLDIQIGDAEFYGTKSNGGAFYPILAF